MRSKSKNPVVVQHNDLISARYHLGMDGFRLLVLILSKANQRSNNPGAIRVTVSEFQDVFGIDRRNVYRSLSKAISSLWDGHIEFYVLNKLEESLTVMRWIVSHKYIKGNGSQPTEVEVEINRKLDPFLFNITSNFSWSFLSDIQRLQSVNAFRIFMYLLCYKNHPKCKRKGHFEVEVSLNQFRSIFTSTSARFADLKRKTIDPAIRDINSHTSLSVNYQEIKSGRSTVAIRFGCVEETASITKPTRPRLAKRPHVTAGSHAEGEWLKTNAEILYQYEKSLKEYDPALKLDMPDLRRAIACARLFKPDWHREKLAELQERQRKPQPKSNGIADTV